MSFASSIPNAGQASVGPARPIPELLAPAGDWECARAAVDNGADGIYFGLERFNARMRAHNFTTRDLPELMKFLHQRGVRGYVTFNTLVFAEELAEAEAFLRTMISAGVDAAIVQDIGIARLIRNLSPDFPIHASTQMTITSLAGMEFARGLGCDRVILARECPLPNIREIHEGLVKNAVPNTPLRPELEVFVHGALCVAYSGQCLTSESLGGRSANRGECAQACRMPFDLLADGKTLPLGDRRYLLSPQDLAGLKQLPELVQAGVQSIKIEGRLKSPDYVANITRLYRKALEKLAAGQNPMPDAQDWHDLEMAFSRGLFTGWLNGVDNQKLVHARFGKKRGVYLGAVQRIQGNRIFVRLESMIKPGDGLVFDAGHPDQPEEGGRVYEVFGQPAIGSEVALTFGRNDINLGRIKPGNKLWKTSDPEMERRIRQTYGDKARPFQRPVCFEVSGRPGQPMELTLRDSSGRAVRLQSALPLEQAEKQPLTTEKLQDQLGRLGGTPFRMGTLENHIQGNVMLPVSELNRLRREAVAQLDLLRAKPLRWTLSPQSHSGVKPVPSSIRQTPELVVLVRNMNQLQTVLDAGISTVYCDFEDPKQYRDAVSLFRTRHPASPPAPLAPAIFVAPPRITRMGEEWILKQVRSCDADGCLARNYDHLSYFKDWRRIGDFSLNVANPLTAEYLVNNQGLEYVTASYDLNADQLLQLVQSAPPQWFEITIHQHMPMFHMDFCLPCAFASKGTDYHDCGRPCEKQEFRLRDRVGAEHLVKVDAGCRNTVYNSRAQTGAECVDRFIALGARRFRIEFLDEDAATISHTIQLYRQLLKREIQGSTLWRQLKLLNRLGVTRGQLEKEDSSVPKFGEIEW